MTSAVNIQLMKVSTYTGLLLHGLGSILGREWMVLALGRWILALGRWILALGRWILAWSWIVLAWSGLWLGWRLVWRRLRRLGIWICWEPKHVKLHVVSSPDPTLLQSRRNSLVNKSNFLG